MLEQAERIAREVGWAGIHLRQAWCLGFQSDRLSRCAESAQLGSVDGIPGLGCPCRHNPMKIPSVFQPVKQQQFD